TGKRNCPPEDVGGVYGYEHFLDAIGNPEHEEHEDFMEWVGEFDPELFELEEINGAMQIGLPSW
ncbi:MAG: LexA family transcriptional regulator, partial [Novipirellula sp. JB048]